MRTRQKRIATDTRRSLGCRPTPLEHWSKRKPTVEPRWAKQQTKKKKQKSTTELMLPIYIDLFNLIFDKGMIPDIWLEGIIHPIYNRKGNVENPENYRPITILSRFSKLFTAVLNARLTKFVDTHESLEENQAGFRNGYSTSDQMFSLYALT